MKIFFRECNSYTWRWNRKKFILYPLWMSLLVYIPAAILALALTLTNELLSNIWWLIFMVAYIYLIYVSIAAYIKRWHDLDKSWWYTLLALVPIINLIVGIYLIFKKWTTWENQFWPDPLWNNNIEETKITADDIIQTGQN